MLWRDYVYLPYSLVHLVPVMTTKLGVDKSSPETVLHDNYPITPMHLDVSEGIPETFDNPVVEAAVVAIVEFQQSRATNTSWQVFLINNIIKKMYPAKQDLGKYDTAVFRKLISQGLIVPLPPPHGRLYVPTHKLLAMVFAKCPNIEYICAKPSEKELTRRRLIYS